MKHSRLNKGVCSVNTSVELDDNGIIQSVEVMGGCNGNLKGICALLKGQSAQDAIQRMQGIDCKGRGTSCPEQIALCLQEALQEK